MLRYYETHACHLKVELRTSNWRVTSSFTKITLYGDTSCTITGSETARDDPHRNRVTGGILRISSMNDIFAEGAPTTEKR